MRDVIPGDYLRLKNLWNDPGSGRFIRKGWSTGKTQAFARAAKGSATRGRLLESGPGLVRIADNRLLRSGLHKGDVVQAGYFDDKYATVRLVNDRGERRFFNVRWERLDDSFRPDGGMPDDGATTDGVADVDLPNPARYERVRETAESADDPDLMMGRVADAARAEYGVWSAESLDDPEQAHAFVAAVARAARDADAFRRAYEAYYEPGQESDDNPLIPPEVLLTDIDLLPQWAGDETHADALGAYRMADMIAEFHQTPRMGESWTPMGTSPAADRIADLNPGFYDYDESESDAAMWDGDRIASAVESSPLMQQMISWFGQPAVSTGRFGESTTLAETQTDLARMTPGNTRLMVGDGAWTIFDTDTPVDLAVLNGDDESAPARRMAVDESFSGVIRHEYGHYIDDVYKSAYQMYAENETLKATQRQVVVDAALELGGVDTEEWPSWVFGLLSEYGMTGDDEMMAELWTLISHPDYPEWKQQLASIDRYAEFLALLNAAETYLNPESDLFVKVGAP